MIDDGGGIEAAIDNVGTLSGNTTGTDVSAIFDDDKVEAGDVAEDNDGSKHGDIAEDDDVVEAGDASCCVDDKIRQ